MARRAPTAAELEEMTMDSIEYWHWIDGWLYPEELDVDAYFATFEEMNREN